MTEKFTADTPTFRPIRVTGEPGLGEIRWIVEGLGGYPVGNLILVMWDGVGWVTKD